MSRTSPSSRFTRRRFAAGLGAAVILPIMAACQAQIVETEKAHVVEREEPVNKSAIVESVITQVGERVVLSGVPGIVVPTNHGWPREVQGLNGRVIISAKPQRIITASVGHDETTLALVPVSRLVGVGSVTKNSIYSNVADMVQDIPEISRDPETIIAQEPDVVVTSPFFSKDGVEALGNLNVPVVQTPLSTDPDTRIDNILFLGYIYGEEDRALRLAMEIRDRYEAILAKTVSKPADTRRRVIALTRYSGKIWTAGAGSTEGSIIETAGGLNAAGEAGVKGNITTNLEGVISMAPEVIIIAQPLEFGAEEFRQDLLRDAGLAEVPAIKSNHVYLVEGKFFTTLSFWNIRGVEELAWILWPEDFTNESKPFSLPSG